MKFKIIFGSEGGTTQYVAGVMQKHLIELGHTADLHHVGLQGTQPATSGYDWLLFGSPTYYSGQLETAMGEFVHSFSTDLAKFKVGIFSLGSQGYPHFCGSAAILEAWVKHQNGQQKEQTLKINGYPLDTTEIKRWVEQLCNL